MTTLAAARPGLRRGAVTQRVALVLALLSLLGLAAGLMAGSEGWQFAALAALADGGHDWHLVVTQIRAPRSLGAWLAGALLGLAGAVAQGLFRNPLADPFLLGSAAGASLGVVLVLAAGAVLGAGAATGAGAGVAAALLVADAGIVAAAFAGAVGGMALTLLLARGASQTLRLLLSGVVVGVMLTAVNDLIVTAVPQALRGRQSFMLGNTAFLGWGSVGWLLLGLLLTAPLAWRLSRTLDALALGEDSARSLGLDLPRLRAALIGALALATGVAVSQAGLIAFVGLVAPHLVRRCLPGPHGGTLLASAATGGVLLLAADVLARSLVAPQELPVGVLTAVLGGAYLLWLLHRRGLNP
jgi:iron complex transport system permease protein